MKYDERTCKFNMDTGCVELLLRDGRKISIDCTGVEDELDVTMAQRTELDYLIYNDPLAYADLILNGEPEEYLKNTAGRTAFLIFRHSASSVPEAPAGWHGTAPAHPHRSSHWGHPLSQRLWRLHRTSIYTPRSPACAVTAGSAG